MADLDEVNGYQDMAGDVTDYTRASVSDAAVGLGQAKEDRKYSNNKSGNMMLDMMSARSALGDAYRYQKYNK
jgi:hypothetical protein